MEKVFKMYGFPLIDEVRIELKIFFYTSGMTRDLIDIYAPGEL
jgi:hypothetical protein